MEFGVFDHLDRGGAPLKDFYEARLRFAEVYDRAGFYAYHLAEHHSTPLGMAPSPSVFLAAVAERTRRLRFGPLVYALPLHHPLRLIEEICMLDHMSAGRLEIGFGRGASPIETALYGQKPEQAQRIYAEALDVVLRGLTQPALDFHGEFFSFDNVPMELAPLQKPHPPAWYGVHSDDSAERAARRGLNIVSLDSAQKTRGFTERYRSVWRETRGDSATIPKMGIGRFIVVGESDKEALAVARRAYLIWHRSFNHLFRLRGGAPIHQRPPVFDELSEAGQGIAGGPATVRAYLQSQLADSGANYLVGQFAFGDLSPAETLRSVALFTRHVMPMLRKMKSES
jgi:alkanesulfonate monooxygenase SsuD/methylene tetrahydromethanopterin reductase-like flavin-dependent oxidoreductase (luciferase family)